MIQLDKLGLAAVITLGLQVALSHAPVHRRVQLLTPSVDTQPALPQTTQVQTAQFPLPTPPLPRPALPIPDLGRPNGPTPQPR
jgi:hypothetical protein